MQKSNQISIWRLITKTIFLFLLFNLLFVSFSRLPYGKVSLYNLIFKGRERLPFGENYRKSYNLTLNNLDAMVNSHLISAAGNQKDHFNIVVIGDSSVWGFLHTPDNTISSMIEKKINYTCGLKDINIFNLGYPSLSILKDIFIIEKILEYDPDLIIWFVTLESFPKKLQTETPLVQNNPREINCLNENYAFDLPELDYEFLDYTIIGQRRNLADIIRLQVLGFLWTATGIDQEYPEQYNPAQRDFEEDETYKDFEKNKIEVDDLSIDLLIKTIEKNDHIDFIVINEPILISDGVNSHIRYNYYYPRWAYDQYRKIMKDEMSQSGIKYYDLWDIVPENEFTNSAIHLTNTGQNILAVYMNGVIKEYCQLQESLGELDD